MSIQYLSLLSVFKTQEVTALFHSFDKNFEHWLFLGHCLREIFQTLHDYNLAWDLQVRTWFDDLDLVSRSHMCQKHKVQIVCFSFFLF